MGGANRVLLKPKAPFRKASDNMWGFNLAGRRMLRVSTDFQMRRHHKCKEKMGSQIDNPSIKWCLNVWIDRLETRAWCRPGGTSLCWDPAERMKFFMPFGNSLYIMCRRG